MHFLADIIIDTYDKKSISHVAIEVKKIILNNLYDVKNEEVRTARGRSLRSKSKVSVIENIKSPTESLRSGKLSKSIARKTSSQIYPILNYTVEDVAESICVIEHALFRKIKARELLNKILKGQSDKNIQDFIAFNNKVSSWVSYEVLSVKDIKKRQKTLETFIKIANHLLKMNNVSSLLNVLNAFDSPGLFRLKSTWEGVGERYMKIIEELKEFVHVDLNHKKIRDWLEEAVPPIVPYLGILLKDLTFINDGNQSTIEVDGVKYINFVKYNLLSNQVDKFLRHQKQKYPVSGIKEINQYIKLKMAVYKTEDELYELSKVVEPKK